MAVAFTIRDMRYGYLDLIDALRREGRKTSPRGMATVEIPSPVIELTDPRKALVTGINRGLNTKLVAAEAVQLVGGFSDPAMLVRVAPNMAQFMDGGAFYGAYGPRVKPQLPEAVRRLLTDPDTRQAQITVWQTPDLFVRTRDLPCTSLLQFLIRDGRLELHVTMRSNDVWWGVPYDIAAFCILQRTVAWWLNLELGSYFHRPVSLHAYERDFEAMNKLTFPDDGGQSLPHFQGLQWAWSEAVSGGDVGAYVTDQQRRIMDLAYQKRLPLGKFEEWFSERLA